MNKRSGIHSGAWWPWRRLLLLVLMATLVVVSPRARAFPADPDELTFDDAAMAAQAWAEENIDPEVMSALASGDRDRIEKLLREVQKQLGSEYVIDLATFKDSVRAALPLLEAHEETLPYALWLKAQLDYLDVAEQLRKAKPPKPGAPPQNPAPKEQREIWVQKLAKREWPEAAQAHVPLLKKTFTAEGVPAELVWIAEVESSFDPRARSPKGAAGLFQLMPVTAKRFGLRTWPFDQRLKPEPSAKAAAQYIKILRGTFQDWRLVLAAYNAGEGTVSRLLKKHKARTFEAIATSLPAETQMFVPRVEATVLRREGKKLSDLKVSSTRPG